MIANPKHIEIQGLLIKIHDEKPTPIYKPYKEIADLLTGCELEEKEEETRKNICKDFK